LGFDCTLHVIDETSITSFEKVFLEPEVSAMDAPFFKKFKNGVPLFDRVKKEIAADPSEGARLLMQLCLMWCSAETPHLPSRNFALSYWFEPNVAGQLQFSSFTDSLEPLLPGIVSRYPQLSGKLFPFFDGNYSTGYFVPAANVPNLRKAVVEFENDLPDDLKETMDPLVCILQVAEKKKMAYWEATDLSVARANDSWLKKTASKSSLSVRTIVKLPVGVLADLIDVSGKSVFISDARPDIFCMVDCSSDTPVLRTISDFFMRTGFTDGDRIIGIGRYGHDQPYRVYELRIKPSLGEPKVLHEFSFELSDIRRAGDETILVPRPLEELPRWLGGSPEEILDLPRNDEWNLKGFEIASFGDGTFLLGWNKRGYHLKGRTITPLLDSFEPVLNKSETVSTEPGCLYTLSDWTLVRITAAGDLTAVFPGIDNVQQLVKGPEGTLLLYQGDNPEGDKIKVVWPGLEITGITKKDLGFDINWLAWSPELNAILAFTGFSLIAIDWATVAGFGKTTYQSIATGQEKKALKEKKRLNALWKKAVDVDFIIDLPVPEDGYIDKYGVKNDFICRNDVVRHPRFGPGLVVGRLEQINNPIKIQFEDETRTIIPIKP
jgi:hypothetical protein